MAETVKGYAPPSAVVNGPEKASPGVTMNSTTRRMALMDTALNKRIAFTVADQIPPRGPPESASSHHGLCPPATEMWRAYSTTAMSRISAQRKVRIAELCRSLSQTHLIVHNPPFWARDPAWSPSLHQSRSHILRRFMVEVRYSPSHHGTDHDSKPLPSFPRIFLQKHTTSRWYTKKKKKKKETAEDGA